MKFIVSLCPESMFLKLKMDFKKRKNPVSITLRNIYLLVVPCLPSACLSFSQGIYSPMKDKEYCMVMELAC